MSSQNRGAIRLETSRVASYRHAVANGAIDREITADAATPRRLLGLQYLRGIAAAGVVIFHVTLELGMPWRLGARGVDLFFVLSGFLMIAITQDCARPGSFFRDRFLRVVPLYWIVTAATLAVGLLGLSTRVSLDPARIATSFAFIPYSAHGSRGIGVPVVPQGWTLNTEMLFYAIFALILFLPRYRMVALTCAIGGLVAAGRIFHPSGTAFFSWTHPQLLEFVAGGWLGVAWVRPNRRVLIVALLLGAMLFWIPGLIGPGLRPGLKGAGATLVVMVVLFFETRGRGIPRWRPLELLGDASYSIYLWQYFALEACFLVGARLHLPIAITAGAALVTAIGGGIVAYWLIERPLLDALRRRRDTGAGVIIPSDP